MEETCLKQHLLKKYYCVLWRMWYNLLNRRKAWVMPDSKYSICGIKNGISILFSISGGKNV